MRRRHGSHRRQCINHYKRPARVGRIGRSAMMRLHLIADDLTGALDTAAQFVGATGSIPVHWRGLPRSATVSSIAIDSGTREAGREEARKTVAAVAAGLPRSPDAISYAKLDSLLRGHAGAE